MTSGLFYQIIDLVNKSAQQKGFIASPPFIIVGAIAAIIVILIATGTLKLSGYVKVDDAKKSQDGQSTTQSVIPTPTEKPKSVVKLNPESFSNSKYGYSISYPEGWKVKEQTSSVTMYKPSETKGADQADALIGVVAGDLGESKDMKLATIADVHKTYLKKQFNNTEIINESEIKVGGVDGFEIEFTGEVKSEKMHGRYIVIKGDKYLYAIVGTANNGLWNDEKANIDASIQTFKLI